MSDKRDDNGIDLSGLYVLVTFILVLAFGVGTRSGNRFMCEQGWAPTFIDCTRLPAK